MTGKTIALASLCCAAAALAPPAVADDESDVFALAPEALFNATVVSVSRTPESVWDAPAAVYVITADDIARAGARSIAEALRLAPGVDVAQISQSSWAVSIRGFNDALANKLLVLVDGREVYDPLFSGVYWDSLEAPLADIDRIEVVRGPGATMWGANAVNGVINIITKHASDTQGLLANALQEDGGGQEYSLRYGATIGAALAWRFYGGALSQPHTHTPSGADANDDWRLWRAGFRADAALSARGDLSLEAETYASETGDLRAAPQFSPPFSVVTPEDLGERGGHVMARWRLSGQNDSEFSLQSYYNFDRHTRLTLDDERRTFSVDAQYAFAAAGVHKLIAGLNYRYTSDRPQDSQIISAQATRISQERLGAFVQDRITLAPGRWLLTLGTKLERQDYTGAQLQPNIRLQWLDGDVQTAWAAVSRAIRSPSEIERDYDIVLAAAQPAGFPVPVSIDLVPNPDFNHETVIAYEAGYRRRIGADVNLDLAVFDNRYSDLATVLTAAPVLSSDPVLHLTLPLRVANASSAEVYGAEATLSWQANERFSVEANVSLLKLDIDAAPGGVDTTAVQGRSPSTQASLRFNWDYADGADLGGTLYYVSRLRSFDIPSYARFDLSWSIPLSPALRLQLVGQNLFDDAHREFIDAADPAATEIERRFYARLTWRS